MSQSHPLGKRSREDFTGATFCPLLPLVEAKLHSLGIENYIRHWGKDFTELRAELWDGLTLCARLTKDAVLTIRAYSDGRTYHSLNRVVNRMSDLDVLISCSIADIIIQWERGERIG